MEMRRALAICFGLCCLAGPAVARAGAQAAPVTEKQTANEVANPISKMAVFQFVFDDEPNLGATDAGQLFAFSLLSIFPIRLTSGWDLISRTTLPVIHQDQIFVGAGIQNGLGDTRMNLFFSPRALATNKIIWGVGPLILFPTATNRFLGTGKWGLGPTASVLRQSGGLTYGVTANQLWSIAGSSSRPGFNTSFARPFVSWATTRGWTFALTSESLYNWKPANFTETFYLQIGKIVKIAGRPVSIAAGPRYWITGPLTGPKRLGFRIAVTLVMPRH